MRLRIHFLLHITNVFGLLTVYLRSSLSCYCFSKPYAPASETCTMNNLLSISQYSLSPANSLWLCVTALLTIRKGGAKLTKDLRVHLFFVVNVFSFEDRLEAFIRVSVGGLGRG